MIACSLTFSGKQSTVLVMTSIKQIFLGVGQAIAIIALTLFLLLRVVVGLLWGIIAFTLSLLLGMISVIIGLFVACGALFAAGVIALFSMGRAKLSAGR